MYAVGRSSQNLQASKQMYIARLQAMVNTSALVFSMGQIHPHASTGVSGPVCKGRQGHLRPEGQAGKETLHTLQNASLRGCVEAQGGPVAIPAQQRSSQSSHSIRSAVLQLCVWHHRPCIGCVGLVACLVLWLCCSGLIRWLLDLSILGIICTPSGR